MTELVPGPEIDVTDAARLADTDQVVLLDVREPDEWSAGHAPQAIHLPLGKLDVSALPEGAPVIAVCRSGNRSARAAQALAAAGVTVQNMTGGMTAWAAAGLPVVREDGSAGEIG